MLPGEETDKVTHGFTALLPRHVGSGQVKSLFQI